MQSIAARLSEVKEILGAHTNFLSEVREIIFQISGVNLTPEKLIWNVSNFTLAIKASPPARNSIFRQRERILITLADHFGPKAPKFIR
ncbi:MAG TPA: hypothetical protein VJB69_01935 [Candidatus Paceibacterota bacterium]